MTDSDRYLLSTKFEEWTTEQLHDYLKSRANDLGGDYSELFANQKIDGKVAHRLKDSDLKEMGVEAVGDRLRLVEEFEKISKAQQQKDREKTLWTGEEVLYVNGIQGCCQTGCGCCPDDPSQYSLSGTHLTIKSDKIRRCGPIKCCFGHSYVTDNVDLTHVKDVDVEGKSPTCAQACCCGKPLEMVIITADPDGKKTLTLDVGEGDKLSKLIMNQVELMQRMERD
mmetsp:Transcript_12212/g.26937  ORF Transcript_12212/g.26937 Transcript_12212/m.26937 type:complete len:225 (-) Transcript_12212:123-797(-)|eukprot:CAMPEP_0168733154 /NCGR_PEP_ID=MMETSP0724-20121128/8140_1 /TAXON_ID=265536 /ORGANISM="Amphiprora sp., Strain CCMP467" /LENGTH=224 /DNA_ID=CAMNT_0008780195 /DNA_START=110 /DNA_END=784 /DNA_ORIENTATION=-